MANKEHLEIKKQGVEAWNEWRKNNPEERPDLSGTKLIGVNLIGANLNNADLSGTDLAGADLSEADLSGADFRDATLRDANLTNADLSDASLFDAFCVAANFRNAILRNLGGERANFWLANLSYINLSNANLNNANLTNANLTHADLYYTDLEGAILVNTNFKMAALTNCFVYGVAAWDVKLNETEQEDLVITPRFEPSGITVDNLEVAQFIYLLLHNEKIRHIIDTITTKVVLILGRFTPERKTILDTIKKELRNRDYIPVLVDFKEPMSRDIKETVSTLAHMARFIIADITDARSVPQELEAIVPNLPSVPVQPLLQKGKDEYSMFETCQRYPWVLSIHVYRDLNDLMATLEDKVIIPAEAKSNEVRRNKE